MPDIALELIKPNPFRDFDLHPIDEAQVDKLRASIKSTGFWVGVVARPTADSLFELAFGHHRIEAARRSGVASVPIDVHELTDARMVLRLASENATQRGTTAAASLDAVAALSRAVIESCLQSETPDGVGQIWPTLTRDAAESIWGKVRKGEQPGRDCIQALLPTGAYTHHQIDLALHVLRDSGRLGEVEAITFDAKCARLFRIDYHLQEFRRIVTGDVVRSYLPVGRQFGFAQKIIAAIGGELTAIKLRERANAIMYEELGMPRHALRNSPLRLSDDRVRDALNLMRRGTHSVKQSCGMLATLMAEGTDVTPEVVDRFKDYIAEIDVALKSLMQKPSGKRSSNLRLIVNREDVA